MQIYESSNYQQIIYCKVIIQTLNLKLLFNVQLNLITNRVNGIINIMRS